MINLTATDNSIQFEFINSPSYPQDGVIECPKNSLTLITDDSDMASFKKSASNDVFISATYDELGMSKEELISWFKENGFSEGGGLKPEEVQEMIDESISGKTDLSAFTSYSASVDTALSNKADVSSLTAYFDGAEYDSNTKRINFYNGNVLKDSIDATAFIKDGMVDTVTISGNNLVISFNTDAGKEDIEIPLTDIFNPNNYYDKTATDTLLDAKLNVSDFNTYSSATQTAIQGKASETDLQALEVVVGTKANATDLNSLANVVNGKVDVSAYTAYTSATDTTIATKASNADLQTVSGVVDTKLNTSDFNTYSGGVDTTITSIQGDIVNVQTTLQGKADTTAVTQSLSSKQDTLVSGTNIKTVNGNSLLGSGDIEIQVEVDDELYINSENAVANSAITKTIQDNELVIANALINLQNDVDGKADASSVNGKLDVSAFTAYSASVDTTIAAKASQTDLNTVSAATASNTTSINTINAQLGGYTLWKGTTAEYEAIVTKDNNTIYFVVD